MRALVSGIGGFVGRHLAAHLEVEGDEVVGLTKPGAGGPAVARLVEIDIRDADAVAGALGELKPDAVYHLAGLSHVGDSFARRRQTLTTNVLGALAVLEGARRLEPKPRLLLVGSAHQYGSAGGPEPLDESAPQRPVSPYALSKVAQERLGRQYFLEEGVPVIAVRAFNHSGPGQEPSFVLPDWAKRIAEIERGLRPPLLEVGDLEVERDFSDVADVARAYRLLVTKGRPGEVYNVCSGVGRSLAELLALLQKLAHVRFAVEARREAQPAELRRFVGSRDKLSREVGYEPRVALADTVAAVLDYWRGRVG